MADWGMLGGVAEGLQKGLDTYIATKQGQEDRKYKDLALALQMRNAGQRINPETGLLEDTEQGRAKRDLENQKMQAEIKELQTRHLDQDLDRAYKRAQIGKIGFETDKAKRDAQKYDEVGGPLTDAEKKVDEEFAKEYNDWRIGGGYSAVDKSLGLLEGAKGDLTKGGVSGPVVGRLPNFLVQPFTEKPKTVQQDVQAGVQNTLRQTLGPQFTEKEGQAIFERAFDPTLSEQENIKKLDTTIKELKARAQAKDQAAKYYEKYGTLKGYKPATSQVASQPQTPPASGQFKTVGNKMYKKVQGGWEEVDETSVGAR